jgi:WD40 repeat protein
MSTKYEYESKYEQSETEVEDGINNNNNNNNSGCNVVTEDTTDNSTVFPDSTSTTSSTSSATLLTSTTISSDNSAPVLQRRPSHVIDKVLHLDALVATVLLFVDMKTLAKACSVCVVWRDTCKMSMFWYPFLKKRWGSLLPMDQTKAKSNPKPLYLRCLESEQNAMREHASYNPTKTLIDSSNTPLCMQFDDDVLMSGHIDKNVHIFDLKSGSLVKKIKGHTSWVKCLQFDRDVLITGSYDSTIKEWSRKDNYQLVKEYKGHGENGINVERSPRGSVVCVQFDATHIVSGSNDTTLRVWNRQTGKCQQIISGHDRTVRCLEFRNNICFSGGSDRYIKVFDLNTGQRMTEFVGHAHRVSCLQMHATNSSLVISGSNDRTARIWDTRVGSTAVALVAEHDEAIRRLQFDGVKLITGGDDQVLRAWDMRRMTSNSSSPDATWEHSCMGGSTRALSRWGPGDPTHHGRVSALQFDATRLVCAFTLGQTTNGEHRRRGSIKVWDMAKCVQSSDERDTESSDGEPTSSHK